MVENAHLVVVWPAHEENRAVSWYLVCSSRADLSEEEVDDPLFSEQLLS